MSSTPVVPIKEKSEAASKPAGGPVQGPSSSAAAATNATTANTIMEARDPLLRNRPSLAVREGDYVLLQFGDGRQIFTQCCQTKGKTTSVRIGKKTYPTHNLVGLPYGTVLEQETKQLKPLPPTAKLIPDFQAPISSAPSSAKQSAEEDNGSDDGDDDVEMDNNQQTNEASSPQQQQPTSRKRDNRSIVDNNTSQALGQSELCRMRDAGVAGAAIVASIVENSATFRQKTDFSKAKYVVRKQMKYQPRCRIVRCHAATICQALYAKDPRKVMNLREDTLSQILSYANLSAGCQTIVLETCLGVVTGAVAQRMGGYGKILSIYSGQQPSFTEILWRFNLSFVENASIKWLHSGDVFGRNDPDNNDKDDNTAAADSAAAAEPVVEDDDPELKEREAMVWPCVLQAHTRKYIERELQDDKKRKSFLLKRQARFARKLCRHTPNEAAQWLRSRPSDSIIIVARYDPTESLLGLWPHLAPSCPFVVFCEFIEPLTECFRELQKQELAINMRLSDTWTREYQVLKDRTHPFMTMSQSGGFILTGIKLDPDTGRNELDEDVIQEIKAEIGGRRRRQRGKPKKGTDGDGAKGRKPKRRRTDKGTK